MLLPGGRTKRSELLTGGGASNSYDANGNRTTSGYQTGTDNRVTSDGTYNYSYDNEGNMTGKSRPLDSTSYSWDYRNRLIEVVEHAGVHGSTVQDDKFTYDVDGRRIGKSTLGGTQTWMVYDGANPYADFNGSGSLTERYLYGQAIDQLFARYDGTNANWYLTDLLGSVRVITDKSANVLDQITFDSYGNIVSETSPSNGDRFKFTGREWDSETGLYYFRARYYNPAIGRFINNDPAGFGAGDANLYRYVNNDPIDATDASGLGAEPRSLDLRPKTVGQLRRQLQLQIREAQDNFARNLKRPQEGPARWLERYLESQGVKPSARAVIIEQYLRDEIAMMQRQLNFLQEFAARYGDDYVLGGRPQRPPPELHALTPEEAAESDRKYMEKLEREAQLYGLKGEANLRRELEYLRQQQRYHPHPEHYHRIEGEPAERDWEWFQRTIPQRSGR